VESPTSDDTITAMKVKASKKKSSKDLLSDSSINDNDQLKATGASSSLNKDIVFSSYVFNQSDSLTEYEMLHLQNRESKPTSEGIKSKDLKKICLGAAV